MLGPLQRKQGDFQEHVYTYSYKEKSKLREKIDDLTGLDTISHALLNRYSPHWCCNIERKLFECITYMWKEISTSR